MKWLRGITRSTTGSRQQRSRIWKIGVLVMLLASFLYLTTTVSQAQQTGLSPIERDVPAFELDDINQQPWNAESLQGKPWVINFWATWCPPCIEEIPSMNAAWKMLEAEGVGMLAINAGEGEQAVSAFLKKVAIDFPVLLGDAATTLPDWSVRGLPTTVIIDASGNVVLEALGPREWNDAAIIEQILALR
jgi:thiol-disulfide isomerase/thioredoxin